MVRHKKPRTAEIYSIAGEHTASFGGIEVWRGSEDEPGFDSMKSGALALIDQAEQALKGLGVTHCIDLQDPQDGPQERPVPIEEFMNRWRKHVKDNYPDDV